jgi:hypothetical protein
MLTLEALPSQVSGSMFYWGGTAYPRTQMLFPRSLIEQSGGEPSTTDTYESQLLFGQAAGDGSAYSVQFPPGFAAALINKNAAKTPAVASELLSQELGARYANEELAPFPRVGHTFLPVGMQSILFGGVTPFMSQYFNSSWAGGIDVASCSSPRVITPALRQARASHSDSSGLTVSLTKKLWWQL